MFPRASIPLQLLSILDSLNYPLFYHSNDPAAKLREPVSFYFYPCSNDVAPSYVHELNELDVYETLLLYDDSTFEYPSSPTFKLPSYLFQ